MSYRAIEDHAVKMIRTFKIRDRGKIEPMFPHVEGQSIHGANIAEPGILQSGQSRMCIIRYSSGRDATAIGTARTHTRFYRTDWSIKVSCFFRSAGTQFEESSLQMSAFNETIGLRMRELYDELARRPTMSYRKDDPLYDINGYEILTEPIRYEEFRIDEKNEEVFAPFDKMYKKWEDERPTDLNPWGRNSSQILGAEPVSMGDPTIFREDFGQYVMIDLEYRVREGYQLVPIL